MTDSPQSDKWPLDAHNQHSIPAIAGAEYREQGPSPAIGAEAGRTVISTDRLTEISARLDQLKTLFEARASEGEERDQWITQLVSQLAEYRNDFVFENITGRIFRDLIQMYDTFAQTLDAATYQAVTKDDVIARLQNLHRQLLKILDRQGVEQIKGAERARFDEAEQEAIATRPVDLPEDDGIVLESARCGFRYGTRLLRPESVIVGRYERKGLEADGQAHRN